VIHWVRSAVRKSLEEAPEVFIQDQAVFLSQINSDRLFELAAAYHIIRDDKISERLLRAALQKNIRHIPSLYGLCILAFKKGDMEKAQKLFSRASRLDGQAASSTLYIQNQLRAMLPLPEATRWSLWCLERLQFLKKFSVSTQFELGKILFERSEFERASTVLRPLTAVSEYSYEVTQYLSYTYERLYSGDELVEKIMEVAEMATDRSDLFFNLAMICQHDQKRLDLAIHFFYLATRSDPKDPGLRFSLEQACMELIGKLGKASKAVDYCQLMLAHLYHGSVAVAERYARLLRKRYGWKYPESFSTLLPGSLWQNWLLKDEGILKGALVQWFGFAPTEDWKIRRHP